ncbi:hypothetical protein C1J01_17745 [Nonomuraea aridisoli]|uniref:Uncharacterized protein n=1 Tax=Nonomuraea aridisoli TaxID=2070368 RepID=A0A2W2E4U9_9ACTN|nr:hypothetical protein C1J01_17745 [Nonomuraea aridisoli]
MVVLLLSVLTSYTRPDLTYVAISDIPPNQVCLAWDSARRNPLIGEFAAIATALRAGARAPAVDAGHGRALGSTCFVWLGSYVEDGPSLMP